VRQGKFTEILFCSWVHTHVKEHFLFDLIALGDIDVCKEAVVSMERTSDFAVIEHVKHCLNMEYQLLVNFLWICLHRQ